MLSRGIFRSGGEKRRPSEAALEFGGGLPEQFRSCGEIVRVEKQIESVAAGGDGGEGVSGGGTGPVFGNHDAGAPGEALLECRAVVVDAGVGAGSWEILHYRNAGEKAVTFELVCDRAGAECDGAGTGIAACGLFEEILFAETHEAAFTTVEHAKSVAAIAPDSVWIIAAAAEKGGRFRGEVAAEAIEQQVHEAAPSPFRFCEDVAEVAVAGFPGEAEPEPCGGNAVDHCKIEVVDNFGGVLTSQ